MPITMAGALRDGAFVLLLVVLGMIVDGSNRQAQAQLVFLGTCNVNMSTVNFGNVDVLQAAPAAASGTMTSAPVRRV